MNKYKIIVYAIAKNEEKFVKRWVDSMKEADDIYVLDTGSDDNTIKLLKENKVKVFSKKIKPWRFDIARNESLKLVPNNVDICVCTDLDEVFEKGWRKKIETLWNKDITRLGYNYNWSLDKNNKPIVNFYIEKIHSRKNYKWTHPIHEVLEYIGNKEENKIFTDTITLNHYPDNTKSRNSYLPLLELSVKEDPYDDRNMHYLGREYMYYGEWNKAIDTLIKHLSLPKSLWKDERCASMRFIARCYKNLKRYEESKMWLDKAMKEAPYLRDSYVERALLDYELKDWKSIELFCNKALEIKVHKKTYINEVFSWNHTIHDLLSLSYFYQGNKQKALEHCKNALILSPDNERLLSNKQIIENSIKNI